MIDTDFPTFSILRRTTTSTNNGTENNSNYIHDLFDNIRIATTTSSTLRYKPRLDHKPGLQTNKHSPTQNNHQTVAEKSYWLLRQNFQKKARSTTTTTTTSTTTTATTTTTTDTTTTTTTTTITTTTSKLMR